MSGGLSIKVRFVNELILQFDHAGPKNHAASTLIALYILQKPVSDTFYLLYADF